MNSLIIVFKSSKSVLSLCMCKSIKILRRSWLIVARRYVLTLSALKDLSDDVLVAGITNNSCIRRVTCPRRSAVLPSERILP